MGKGDHHIQQAQRQDGFDDERGNGVLSDRCFIELSGISFKCVFFLMLGFCLLLSAIYWIFPFHSSLDSNSDFDAKDETKLQATLQGYFRLVKPVSQLVMQIGRLEYDINDEIGIPNAKVAILSMHRSGASNWTDVVFGFLPDPINVPINPVSLSVLRSSLIDLFLLQFNLSLTVSSFGQPSKFEILKVPGGITVIPMQYASIWQMPHNLFNFTLNNSVSEVLDNFGELKDQLEVGLQLMRFESVYVKITTDDGSTMIPPVTIQVSVLTNLGTLLPQRLKQLAQTIAASPVKNLGLSNSVFGKVKSVVLSSYLKGTLQATAPSSSPAPSPQLSDGAEPQVSPYPAIAPSLPPTTMSSDASVPPAMNGNGGCHHPFSPVNPPPPSVTPAYPPHPCLLNGCAIPPSTSPSHSNPIPHLSPVSSPSRLPPNLSPSPGVSYGSSPEKGSASSLAPSLSSLAVNPFYRKICLLGFGGLFVFHLLCWPH